MNAGIELMRQNIRRSNPKISNEQAEQLLTEWLWRTDDPIPGDTDGQVRVREIRCV